MEVIQDDLWLCQDCTIVAVNGDWTWLDYYYSSEAEQEERRAEIEAGLSELGAHLVPNFDSEAGDGMEEFSSRHCDCCGTDLAGGRTRFAILGEGDTGGYGLVDSLGSKRRREEQTGHSESHHPGNPCSPRCTGYQKG